MQLLYSNKHKPDVTLGSGRARPLKLSINKILLRFQLEHGSIALPCDRNLRFFTCACHPKMHQTFSERTVGGLLPHRLEMNLGKTRNLNLKPSCLQVRSLTCRLTKFVNRSTRHAYSVSFILDFLKIYVSIFT